MSQGEEWRGKQVALVGLGQSNRALARFLVRHGARVVGYDRSPARALAGADELTGLGVRLETGPDYLDRLVEAGPQYATIFLTPGMSKHQPQLRALREAGAAFSSEIGLVFRYCQAPIYGITGSAGKTTTTSLVGAMLTQAGLETHVGGNIGTPLIDIIETIPASAKVVLELSSFQLELLDQSPAIGALLNIRPNHLDIHGSFAEYRAAKANIFRHQRPDQWAVVNADDEEARSLADQAPARVAWFSRERPVRTGTALDGERVCWRDAGQELTLFATSDIRLPGKHNLANVLAAAAVANLAGVPPAAMRDAVRSFRGVPHRLELVAEIRGVRYVNDSIATAPDRTLAALATYDDPLIVIAGGYDKGIPFDELGEALARRAKAVLLLGKTADQIEAAIHAGGARVGRLPLVRRVSSLDAAVRAGQELAAPRDIVLLSPACASYDMFRNFEERGERFRQLVQQIAESQT